MRRWLALFHHEGRIDWALAGVFVGMNALVAVNAVLHSPFVGYDAADHLIYIEVLATGRLPTPVESGQFFAPPLPYIVPAMLHALRANRWGLVLKIAQAQNVAWSIALTLALVGLCRLWRPGDRRFAFWSLALLGTLPVYYKTFAFVRGEPLTAFLTVAAASATLALCGSSTASRGRWLGLGVLVGLLMLSRQWAAFVVVALLVFLAWCVYADPSRRRAYLLGGATAAMVGLAVCGWFYLLLHQRYGSAMAFNQAPGLLLSLAARPAEFYTRTGWPAIVTAPFREAFSPGDEARPWLWPVLYSETWGDYWGYWVVRGRDPETGAWVSGEPLADLVARDPRATNRDATAPYLGRVNAVALVPTAILAVGLIAGIRAACRVRRGARGADTEARGSLLATSIVMVSCTGYGLLLARYPDLDVKASYLLHVAPFLSLLGAAALVRLADRAPAVYRVVSVLLLAVALHNAPVFVTRYFWW